MAYTSTTKHNNDFRPSHHSVNLTTACPMVCWPCPVGNMEDDNWPRKFCTHPLVELCQDSGVGWIQTSTARGHCFIRYVFRWWLDGWKSPEEASIKQLSMVSGARYLLCMVPFLPCCLFGTCWDLTWLAFATSNSELSLFAQWHLSTKFKSTIRKHGGKPVLSRDYNSWITHCISSRIITAVSHHITDLLILRSIIVEVGSVCCSC